MPSLNRRKLEIKQKNIYIFLLMIHNVFFSIFFIYFELLLYIAFPRSKYTFTFTFLRYSIHIFDSYQYLHVMQQFSNCNSESKINCKFNI